MEKWGGLSESDDRGERNVLIQDWVKAEPDGPGIAAQGATEGSKTDHYPWRVGSTSKNPLPDLRDSAPGGQSGGCSAGGLPLFDETNPKDRVGDTKLPLAWVPPAAVIYCARAFQIGGNKYGPYNWRAKSVRQMVYLNALLRHAMCLIDGEDVDTEGNSHLGAIMACAGILADAKETGNLIDDRPPAGAAPRLLTNATQTPIS